MRQRFLLPLLCLLLSLGQYEVAAGNLQPLHPEPSVRSRELPKTPRTRLTYSRVGDPHRGDRPFQEKDFTTELGKETGPVHHLTPEEQALVAALADPTYLRQLRSSTNISGRRLPMQGGPRARNPISRDLPWSPNQLLANPTDMNDEYVSLAQNPVTGHLYAVFAARDLGGTDRDIHIAVSEDGGETWSVQEMPSSSIDEYHPEIAVDGGGYIHVVWVRDDGWILRARTAQPGDITDWAWVKGLGTEETMATPSITVSGAGDFARVFIAAGWLTINWDLYQNEWTLLFMASSNGGQTVTYDYFLPDGYQDLWPDVGMNAGTVHFVNAEVDYYTGETEILLATDAFTGSFGDPGLITGYTPNSCGFPQLACQGDNVYVVYQEDFADGLTVDGDITYTYSWDAGGTFYGPIGLVADPYESVGPSVFVRDGVVGVLWLDGPPGADEFELAARLGAGAGHSDFFGDVEIVTEQPRVEPMFHSCFGVATGDRICAAWIDRRDFPTQGHNVYTSRQLVAPNLAAFTPSGWSDAMVGNIVRSSRTTGFLASEDTTYVSFALANTGLADFTEPFAVDLRLDDTLLGSWTLTGGMTTGTYFPVEELPVFVEEEGTYTLTATLDLLDNVPESNETDNAISRTWTWVPGAAKMRFPTSHITKSILPEMSRTEAWRLVDQPLLRQENHLPVIAPELATAMAGAAAEERLRVMIVPAERLDPVAMGQALQGAAKMTRREVIIEAAKRQIAKSENAVAHRLGPDRVQGWQALWLAGAISARLNPADILDLAGDPQIGLLYLDNIKSQTYAAEQNIAERATAWHLTEIGVELAWAQGLTGAGIVVGHLDSGVAYDHPDLNAAMWDGGADYPHHGWDAVDDDDDPYDGDTDWGHGTHTAGLIVGNGASGTTTGAAPGATLMALRAVPGYLDDLIEAMQFGLDNGAHLFSLSGGWSQASAQTRAANRYNAELLLSIDVPWICAAGNGDNYGGHYAVPTDISSPGDCPNPWYAPNGGASGVITVGATVQGGQVWDGSSFGPTSWNIDNTYGDSDYHDYPYTPGLMKPDLAAPGANVISTSNHGGYITYSGTSMATPLITGVVCLLWSGSPQLLVPQVCELLETTATDLVGSPAAAGRDNYTGAGLVDVATAMGQVPSATAELFWICNDGDLPLVIEDISWTDPWLEVVVPTMIIAPDDSIQAAAFIDPTLTVEGYHNANVVFRTNEHRPPRILPITLIYGDQYSTAPGQTPLAATPRLTNHPNPFNPRTVVHFANPREGRVQLSLYDLKGRLVRTLVDGPVPAGNQQAMWDGQDDGGRPLPSGTYLARARLADGQIVQGKLMLVR